MKWIKGQWDKDKTQRTIYVNPTYITCVDPENHLLWAQDCDVAVRYDKEEEERLLKIIGRTEEDISGKPSKEKK